MTPGAERQATSCQYVRRRVELYLDRALPPEEHRAVASHLTICPDCRTEVAETEEIEARLRAVLRDEAPPQELWPRIAGELRAEGGPAASAGQTPRVRQLPRRVAMAAIALLVIGVVLWRPRPPARSIDMAQLMETPVNELRSFVDSGRAVDFPTGNPAELRQWFVPRIDFTPPAPPMRAGLTLIGGRLCYFFGRRIASYMYNADSYVVSLYIMSDRDIEPPLSSNGTTVGNRPAVIREANGFAHILWKGSQLYYSLVSDQPARQLIEMAREMAALIA